MAEKPLTFFDYMNRPMLELMSHPDFDETVYQKVAKVSNLTNDDIRKLTFGGNGNA